MDVCPRCSGPLDPTTAAYDERGTLICRSCNSHQSAAAASALIVAGDPTTTRNLYGGAAAASFLGLVVCCASSAGIFFFLAAPLPILTGGATLRALLGDPTAKERLGGGYFFVLGLSIVGVGFGFLSIAIGLLLLVLSAQTH